MRRYGKYFTVYFCRECHRMLSWGEVMGRHGTCPHCGHTSTSTVCSAYVKAARRVFYHPWWMFWRRPGIEFKDIEQ